MNWKEDIYFSYINLHHRADRDEHMKAELNRVGIEAVRFEAFNWRNFTWDERWDVMKNRTPGAMGCWASQCAVMAKAWQIGMSPGVLEDDLIICSDFKERMDYIETFLSFQDDWDIMYLGGTVHVGGPWWHSGNNPDLPGGPALGRDAQCTIDPRILRVYGAFSTHAYIVNIRSVEKVLLMLEEVLPEAMGIDWALIKLAPKLKCFMFVPGCIKQMDNQSDIGSGVTVFSGFSKLNGTIENSAYWWQDKMTDFDPTTFDWKECK